MGWAVTVLRVELGDTRDPAALVPGDPAAVTHTARTLDRFGAALCCAGEGLRRIDTGGWTGTAADRFRQVFSTEPQRWISSGQAFTATAQALGDYAHTLAWAQAQAAEAIALWDQGEAQTEHAKAAHTAAVHQAHQHALFASLAGVFVAVPDLPFHDPGQATRDHARDLLDRARAQLADAGNHTEQIVADGRDQAPAGPRWWQTGWRLLSEFQTGVAEAGWELATFAWATSPQGIAMDPDGFVNRVTAMAQGAWYGVQHPVEFAKAVTDWETWQSNPARALGRLVPDLALTIATGGTATTTRATTRAASKGPTPAHRLDNTPTPPPQHHPAPHVLRGAQTGTVRVQPPTARPGPTHHHTDLTPGPEPDFGPTGQPHAETPPTIDMPANLDGTAEPHSGSQPTMPWDDDPAGYDPALYDREWHDPPDLGEQPTDRPAPPEANPPTPADRTPDTGPPLTADRDPAQDYLGRSDFQTTEADHQAYRDRFGPPTDSEQRTLAEWWTHHPHVAQLANEELLALLRYTLDHDAINHALRTGDTPTLLDLDPQIREAVSALNKLPDHHGTVYRGIHIDPAHLDEFLNRYRSGATVQELGFTSTDQYAPYQGNVQFVIESHTGKYIPRLSDTIFGLHEVLFPPGHTFHVDKVMVNPHTREVFINLSDQGH